MITRKLAGELLARMEWQPGDITVTPSPDGGGQAGAGRRE